MIYTLCSSFEFIGTIVAGYMFDTLGYRTSLLVGWVFWTIGYWSIFQSHQSAQLYYLGGICAGLSVNIVAYPGMFLKDFFPKHKGNVIVTQLAGQWASSSIFTFINTAIDNGHPITGTTTLYGLIGIPFMILYYLVLPSSRERNIQDLRDAGIEVEANGEKPTVKDVLKTFLNFDILIFCFFSYIPLICTNTIYIELVDKKAKQIGTLLGQLRTYQFLVCIAYVGWGLLGTKTWMFWTPFATTFIGSIIMQLTLVVGTHSYGWQAFGAAYFIFVTCYSSVTKYHFTAREVDAAVFGSVCGFIGTVAGAVHVNLSWIVKLSTNHLTLLVWAFITAAILGGLVMIFIGIRAHRGKMRPLRYIVAKDPDEPVLEALILSNCSALNIVGLLEQNHQDGDIDVMTPVSESYESDSSMPVDKSKKSFLSLSKKSSDTSELTKSTHDHPNVAVSQRSISHVGES